MGFLVTTPVEVEIENTNSEEALVVDLAERPATDLRSILNLLSAMNRIEDVAKTEISFATILPRPA